MVAWRTWRTRYALLSPELGNDARTVRPRLLASFCLLLLASLGVAGLFSTRQTKPDRFLRVEGYDGPAPVSCRLYNDVDRQLDADLIALETGPRDWTRKIWQSSKEVTDLETRDSWRTLNPSWQYELLTDDEAVRWVDRHLPKDLVDIYHALPLPVMRADLLRYALLWAEGGAWADTDTLCWRPIEVWVPTLVHSDLLVGIEMDLPLSIDPKWQRWGWAAADRGYDFAQWTLQARRHAPHLRRVLVNLASRWRAHQSGAVKDQDVITITGPVVFTDSLLEEISCTLARPVGWMEFSNISSVVNVGRLLVLPTVAFNGENGVDDDSLRYVKHLFASSWKVGGSWWK